MELPTPLSAVYPPLPHPNESASQLPRVALLLYQEAEGWRSVLQLHLVVANATRNLVTAMSSTGNSIESECDATRQREATYCASLSDLATRCDTLASEALRLRALRKTRASLETHILDALFKSHSDEAVATATSCARDACNSLQSLSMLLRRSASDSQNELSELHTVGKVLLEHTCFANVRIVVQSCVDSLEPRDVVLTPAQILNECAGVVTQDTILAALSRLCIVTETKEKEPKEPNCEAPAPRPECDPCSREAPTPESAPVKSDMRPLVRRALQ